jgi:uncharacterized membrane protein YbaN (DUF454 family)
LQPQNFAQHVKRRLYLIVGLVFLVIGVIGLVIPVLPTTPFILLAGLCFMRSSSRFYVWIRYHPRFRTSFEKKGLTIRGKITILLWAWIILLLGAIFTPILWVKFLLIGIGLIKTFVFTKIIRTVKNEQKKSDGVLNSVDGIDIAE